MPCPACAEKTRVWRAPRIPCPACGPVNHTNYLMATGLSEASTATLPKVFLTLEGRRVTLMEASPFPLMPYKMSKVYTHKLRKKTCRQMSALSR